MSRYPTPGPERQWVRVFKALRAGADTSAAIAEATTIPLARVSSHLANMADAGLVVRVELLHTGRAGRPSWRWAAAA